MPVVVDEGEHAPYALLRGEAASVENVARLVCASGGPMADDLRFIRAAREGWDELPIGLRRAVRRFRRHSGPDGTLALRGLPIGADQLGETPCVAGSVQRKATTASAVLLMVASGLGDPAAFRSEKSGALVQDVVPVPGQERFQGNTGSVLLSLHNENAFHEYRPDYVMLLCLRPDHDRIAGTRTASVRSVLHRLDDAPREALMRPEFITHAPPSFAITGDASVHSVLSGAPEDPDVRVDFATTKAITRAAAEAMTKLGQQFSHSAVTSRLLSGDLVIIDNHAAVHGRSSFTPRYDGRDRWLQRTFVLADVRRSRACRPGDGHVLA